jgi:hypothetical protein
MSDGLSQSKLAGNRNRAGQGRIGFEIIGVVAVELTPDDLRDMESATAKIKIEGARCS